MSLALVLVLALVTPLRAGGLAADVTIDFLADGRCAVSARGEGFRSNATYMPDGANQPKRVGTNPTRERRCAMPPVPPGRTVSLRVSMPTGATMPGTSTPALTWTEAGNAWVGTASLTDWPDAVVVSPATPSKLTRLSLIGAGLLLAAAAFGLRRSRTQTQSAI